VDLVVAPNVWSSGTFVRRRFDKDVREKVKFSGLEVRDWIVDTLASKVGSGCYCQRQRKGMFEP
jgi:hypothetical protein